MYLSIQTVTRNLEPNIPSTEFIHWELGSSMTANEASNRTSGMLFTLFFLFRTAKSLRRVGLHLDCLFFDAAG